MSHLRRFVSLAPLAVALASVSSCGGGSGSGPLTFDRLKTQFVPAVCKELVACGEMPDQATCQATLHFATSELETFQVDIGNGKIVYDASAAGRCADLFNMISSCNRSEIEPILQQAQAACNDVFKGTVAAGGACFFNEECASASCQKTGCAGACCAGACTAVVAPIPVGGDCSVVQPNQSCASGSACHVDAQTGNATCVVLPTAVGAACTDTPGCDPSLYCDADATTGVGTCKRGAATGATCNPALGSLSCDDARDTCDITTSLCTAPTPVGGACDPTNLSNCVGYASCSSATSTCQARAKTGEACGTNGQSCLTDLTCDTTTGTCVTSQPPGPACM
jgi:hypothetical protein